MDESLARWLGLREASDAAARSDRLARMMARRMPAGADLRLLDLASGTGSNIRYLAERLAGSQHWLAVDRSADLLAELQRRMLEWGAQRRYDVQLQGDRCVLRGPRLVCRIETRQMDLGELTDPQLFEGVALVTASALLDLVSERWLRTLAGHCRAAGAAAFFAITYNGISTCTPAEPEDTEVLELFNRHQKTDKGLGGPAAGPDAVHTAARAFAEAGYTVEREPSPWTIDQSAREMQRMLVDGWAQASTEIAPERTAAIADWRRRRMAHIDASVSRIIVGHEDLAAYVAA